MTCVKKKPTQTEHGVSLSGLQLKKRTLLGGNVHLGWIDSLDEC